MIVNGISEATMDVSVSNIGGINETTVELVEGVNVLVGRNATNRTSFLQSLMAASGSTRASLKGDADEGRVEIDIGPETYTRVLTSSAEGVDFSGDSVFEDTTTADLFSFLLEDNEARRAIAREEDLRELVMRPVDTDELTDRIDSLVAERDRIDDELESTSAADRKHSTLTERRAELRASLTETEGELEEKRTETEAADSGVAESMEEQDELDAALEALNEKRSELERITSRIENQRASLGSVREERNETADRLERIETVSDEEIASLNSDMQSLRKQKRRLDSSITQLQSLIQFNEEMIQGENTEILEFLSTDSTVGTVADALLPENEQASGRCWTCGSEVKLVEIEDTLERLRTLVHEKRQERSAVSSTLEDVQNERKELETAQQQHTELTATHDELETEIEDRVATIDRLTADREALKSEIEELERRVAELGGSRRNTLLELHREANELQFERDELQDELAAVESEIDELERVADHRAELEVEREEATSELEGLRGRIEQLEASAVESFNEHMEIVLDVLEYQNLSRVWLERATHEVRQGRETIEQTIFRIHVIRTDESGAAYEDTIAHLSESEREVVGLVFCLAGYLVHAVYEDVPFMLLDSLEAVDSGRIAKLVEYFEEHAPYTVVALLPEDAQALDNSYHRITAI